MTRLGAVIDSNADDSQTASDDSGPRRWRTVLAALGLAAAGYALLRWRSRDSKTASETLASEAREVLEDAQPIEIGEPGEESESDRDEAEEESRDAEGDEREDESESRGDEEARGDADGEEGGSIDTPTTDRSSEEITERTESDVQEEPAEPGEMTIDEEVADEVIDEDADESER